MGKKIGEQNKQRSTIVRGWIAISVVLALTSVAGCHRAESTPLPVLSVGGDFVLTDHNNQRFELSSLRGKAVLIFFGYTSCPDVCPTTLSKLSAVYKRLGGDARYLKTLYITVDPERDTPAVLKADLGYFDLDALGLTGTKSEIDKVVGLYRASYEIIPTPQSVEKYTVAHSTTLFALDRAGRTRIVFPYEASVDDIVKGVQSILASRD
jgi:protein SCO1